ncbi:unnamed protein product [Leptosia nina]|uniref:Cathepsin propeptide inhibitor domain-containing protein n=1 Tax=Leptosia nina TaxID=320188 RepID=A0AAV1JFD9_9NEOP
MFLVTGASYKRDKEREFVSLGPSAPLKLCSYSKDGEEPTLIYNLRDGPQIYKKYVEKFNKTYSDDEYYTRYHNFMNTLRQINYINSKKPQKVQPNKYADWSDDERRNVEATTKIDWELTMQLKDLKPNVDSLIKDLIL